MFKSQRRIREFLKNIKFLNFLPENCDFLMKMSDNQLIREDFWRKSFWNSRDRKDFNFSSENLENWDFSWKLMKIHVEGPMNAYIHLVDSFLALKVETFDRFTFEQLSGLFMNISIIRRHLPLHHANISTLKNIFIINNLLIF